MAPANALSGAALAASITSLLPQDASPQLKDATDAIAIACHATMLEVGFRLVGLSEDHTLQQSSEAEQRRLPSDWNLSATKSFRYKHTQSSMEYLLQVSRLGAKTVILGIAMGDDKPAHLHLTTADYISSSALPATPVKEGIDTADIKRSILSLFNSENRLTDLANELRVQIIQKLIPGLQKEGYEDTTSSRNTRDSQRDRDPQPERQRARYDPIDRNDPPAQPHPLMDPSIAPRRPPIPAGDFPPPDFEDEYEMLRPRGGPGGQPGFRPPGYGERDLYPQGLGPHDPLRVGGIGPGLRGSGGGMHPTFDDPLFGGRDERGFDPQAPPGARYDPIGPGDMRPQGQGRRFGPGGGGGFGGPPNPFSGFGSGDFI